MTTNPKDTIIRGTCSACVQPVLVFSGRATLHSGAQKVICPGSHALVLKTWVKKAGGK